MIGAGALPMPAEAPCSVGTLRSRISRPDRRVFGGMYPVGVDILVVPTVLRSVVMMVALCVMVAIFFRRQWR